MKRTLFLFVLLSLFQTVARTQVILTVSPAPTHAESRHGARAVKQLPQSHPLRIRPEFSGYAIELLRTKTPVKKVRNLLLPFGTVCYDQAENGDMIYLITRNFPEPATAATYLKEVIQPLAPDARLYYYSGGSLAEVGAAKR